MYKHVKATTTLSDAAFNAVHDLIIFNLAGRAPRDGGLLDSSIMAWPVMATAALERGRACRRGEPGARVLIGDMREGNYKLASKFGRRRSACALLLKHIDQSLSTGAFMMHNTDANASKLQSKRVACCNTLLDFGNGLAWVQSLRHVASLLQHTVTCCGRLLTMVHAALLTRHCQ
jgi:hypothetical protein